MRAHAAARASRRCVDGARQRMRLVGHDRRADRARSKRSGKVQPRVTLDRADRRRGRRARRARRHDGRWPARRCSASTASRTVWVNAEVPESQAAQVRPGSAGRGARAGAARRRRSRARCSAILPEVNPATRTLKARIELANPGGAARCRACSRPSTSRRRRDARPLLVPSEAVIQTGTAQRRDRAPRTTASSQPRRRRDRRRSERPDRDPQGPRAPGRRSSSRASS